MNHRRDACATTIHRRDACATGLLLGLAGGRQIGYNGQMQPALRDPPPPDSAPSPALPTDGIDEAINVEQHETRNLLVLAAYQVVVRVGWIFKTESVIMPAFLDHIASGPSAGLLRSLLPLLNRFGQSVPPMFFAARLCSYTDSSTKRRSNCRSSNAGYAEWSC